MNIIIDKKLEEFEINLFNYLGKKPKKKQIDKKEDEKNEIIQYKGKNLIEILKSELIKITNKKKVQLETNDMNELKKISSAILIKGGLPFEMINEFFDKNYYNELNQDKFEYILNIKAEIFICLQDISIKDIKTKDIDEYVRELRKRHGITVKDLDDKNLKKLITKYKFDYKTVIIEIFKKMKM